LYLFRRKKHRKKKEREKNPFLSRSLMMASLLTVALASIAFLVSDFHGVFAETLNQSPITRTCHDPVDTLSHGHVAVAEMVTTFVTPGSNAPSDDISHGTLAITLEYCPHYQSFFTRLRWSKSADPNETATFWPLTDCFLEARSSGSALSPSHGAFCYGGRGQFGSSLKVGAGIIDSPVRADNASDTFWHACWSDAFQHAACTPWMKHTRDQPDGSPLFEPANGTDGQGQCNRAQPVPVANTTHTFSCRQIDVGPLPQYMNTNQ